MSTNNENRRSVPVAESMSDSGLWAFESRHDESFFMTETRHRFPKLLVLREGAGEVVADWAGEGVFALPCGAGDCVLVPAAMGHRIVDDARQPISLYGLAIDPNKITPCAAIEQMIPVGKLPRQRMTLLNIEQRVRRLLYLVSRGDPASTLSAIAAAIEVFARLALASAGRVDPPRNEHARLIDNAADGVVDDAFDAIDEYIVWLRCNFFEALNVESAAAACGMSRRKFTTDFRKRTGQTWLAFSNSLRVDHAKTLLRDTENKVTSIAFRSGFEDLSTFYRTFKRFTGSRPLDFRYNFDSPPQGPNRFPSSTKT